MKRIEMLLREDQETSFVGGCPSEQDPHDQSLPSLDAERNIMINYHATAKSGKPRKEDKMIPRAKRGRKIYV